jgi:hypothetical protein
MNQNVANELFWLSRHSIQVDCYKLATGFPRQIDETTTTGTRVSFSRGIMKCKWRPHIIRKLNTRITCNFWTAGRMFNFRNGCIC